MQAPHKTAIDTLWQPRTLIWAVMLVLALTLALVIAPGQAPLPLLEQVLRFALLAFGTLWIAILVIAVLYLLRNRLGGLDAPAVAWVALGVMLVVTAGVSAVVWWAVPGVSDLPLGALMLRNLAFAALLGLFGMVAFLSVWTNHILRLRARLSELAALQARTRPHFLFNTLNAAIALVRQQPERVEALLLDLSDLLHAALAAPQEWDFDDELELTRKYLAIEALRFGPRLDVHWSLPEPLPALRLPMLSLQPLVENAVLHGIERRPNGGRLEIALREQREAWVLTVRNELGDTSMPERVGHNVGIEAVRERVRQFTGGRGELRAGVAGDRFEAQLVLPRVPQAPTTS